MTPTNPKTFRIADLLANGEQPWGPLDADTYHALREEIFANKGKLIVPVVLSARLRLIDGHHRLQIAQEYGRKTITADEVRIDKSAKDPESEALAAIGYQRNRRQTTSADNANAARDLMRRFGWSQGMVAQKIGVSAAAVSQWFKAHPDPTFELSERRGLDGRIIDVSGISEAHTIDPDLAESDPEVGVKPEPRTRRSMKGPDSHVARHRMEIANDEFAHWVTSWAASSASDAVERVATDLDEIARATATLADSLRAINAADPGADASF